MSVLFYSFSNLYLSSTTQCHFTINVKPETISGAINVKHRHHLVNYQCQTLGMILSFQCQTRHESHKLLIPSFRHDLELSISSRTQSRKLSMPNTGHDLDYQCQTRLDLAKGGTITSLTVI